MATYIVLIASRKSIGIRLSLKKKQGKKLGNSGLDKENKIKKTLITMNKKISRPSNIFYLW